jgi:uncharacterized RDD family membrane protein YckC
METANPYLPPAAEISRTQAPTGELAYAGFWRRFGAYWLDFLILLPLIGLTVWLGGQSRMFQLYYFLPGVAIGLWFHVYLVKRFGGTPGKRLLGLSIRRLDGSPAGLREASIRHCVLFVLTTLNSVGLLLATLEMSDSEYLGLPFAARALRLVELAPSWHRSVTIAVNIWVWSEFVVMLCNRRRRGVHDFMAGTVVVRNA